MYWRITIASDFIYIARNWFVDAEVDQKKFLIFNNFKCSELKRTIPSYQRSLEMVKNYL